jgi:hypothetical protein
MVGGGKVATGAISALFSEGTGVVCPTAAVVFEGDAVSAALSLQANKRSVKRNKTVKTRLRSFIVLCLVNAYQIIHAPYRIFKQPHLSYLVPYSIHAKGTIDSRFQFTLRER